MLKFYNPNDPGQFQDVPKLFDRIPIKQLVLFMQFIFLLFQIGLLCFLDGNKFLIFFQIIFITLFAFTMAGFFFENKCVIRTHYYLAIVAIIGPIIALGWSILDFAQFKFTDSSPISAYLNPTAAVIFFIIVLVGLIFYVMMCRRLVNAMYTPHSEYPEDLDTTQGLFRFNRDPESVKLIYPKV